MLNRRTLIIAAALTASSSGIAFAKRSFKEGRDYLVLPSEVPTDSNSIVVTEFFAYTCPHCLQFEPYINEWNSNLPKNVKFEMSPVAWQKVLEPFVRTYYVIRALGRSDLHQKFFENVVYQEDPINFENPAEDIKAIMVKNSVDPQQWDKLYRSFSVGNSVKKAEYAWRAFNIDSTPMISVGGKYVTGPHLVGNRRETIDCINFLVEKVRAEKNL